MKRSAVIGVAVLAAILAAGCASNKEFVPTGGSRSDGTIKMSYQYGAFELPQVDLKQAVESARQRCAAWGYSGAEPFGGSTKTCIDSSSGSCNVWRVTAEYQCTGAPKSK